MADQNSVLYEIIGQRISEMRKNNNDNQQQLADKIGVSRSSISNIEAGRQQITLHTLYTIAQVYNSDIYALIPKVQEVITNSLPKNDDYNELLKKQDISNATRKQILELLK